VREEEFWRQTPRQTVAAIRAANRRWTAALERGLFTAWHAAVLGRGERVTPLADLLDDFRQAMARVSGDGDDGEQSAETQLATLKTWLAAREEQ
jgi:hypothetical protein